MALTYFFITHSLNNFSMNKKMLVFLLPLFVFFACSKPKEEQLSPKLIFSTENLSLESVKEGEISNVKTFTIKGQAISKDVEVNAPTNVEISSNSTTFSNKLTLLAKEIASEKVIYVRYNAKSGGFGMIKTEITFSCAEISPDNMVAVAIEIIEVPKPTIIFSPNTEITDFKSEENGSSAAKTVNVSGKLLSGNVNLVASEGYVISSNNVSFFGSLTLKGEELNVASKPIYVKFKPTEGFVGVKSGSISAEAAGAVKQILTLSGTAIALETFSYFTFNRQRLAFGGGFEQSATQIFDLHTNVSKISKVYMYVRLKCPSGGCNAWDVYANVLVKDPKTNEFLEIGRYITPYGIDNSKIANGFRIDVTDFKSLLQGKTELKAYIETWGSDGWLLSVDFDYVQGLPDYAYTAISRVMQYNKNSLEGVPYGESTAAFDLTKTIKIPANAEKTTMRTIITGWGHALPEDSDGRPCAEWCFRTHYAMINGAKTFPHEMKPIGCAKNKVSGQGGNWQPDRAGWCPGMEVPVRTDEFKTSMAGETLNYEYTFEPWINNGGNGRAFYAISSYIVVKSNTPIERPTVIE